MYAIKLERFASRERLDSELGLLLGLVVTPGEPAEPGQAAPGIAHPEGLPRCIPDLQRLPGGFERIVDPVGEIALVAQRPEHVGATKARQPVAVAKNAPILPHRLPMSAKRRSSGGRLRGEREHRVGIGGRLRVVRHPGMVDGHSAGRAVAQRREDLSVNRNPAESRHLLGHGQPGKLVSEVHLVPAHHEQSVLQRFVDFG